MKNVVGKLHDLRSKPAAQKEESEDHSEEFNHEGESLLLNLRCSLEDGNKQPEHRADQDRGTR